MKSIFYLTILFPLFFTSMAYCQHPRPYNILSNYIPSGYMGDINNIRVVRNHRDLSRPDSLCVRITYQPGSEGWAGVAWQYPANNWCTKPGRNFSGVGYTRITFWVKGENGNEEVKFKSGQDCGDSNVSEELTQMLDRNWTQLTIDLTGRNLSNITGAFMWIVDSHANSGTVTFYIDDVQFE